MNHIDDIEFDDTNWPAIISFILVIVFLVSLFI